MAFADVAKAVCNLCSAFEDRPRRLIELLEEFFEEKRYTLRDFSAAQLAGMTPATIAQELRGAWWRGAAGLRFGCEAGTPWRNFL